MMNNIAEDLHDKICLKLGVDELRLFLNHLHQQSWKIDMSVAAPLILHRTTRNKLQNDIK